MMGFAALNPSHADRAKSTAKAEFMAVPEEQW